MKKASRLAWLLALLPATIGIILAVVFSLMTANDYPDPTYPYRTHNTLNWLSSAWLIVGVSLSGLALVLLAVEASFDRLSEFFTRRSIQKNDERRQKQEQLHNKAL